MLDPTLVLHVDGCCRGSNPLVLKIFPNAEVEVLKLPGEIPFAARLLTSGSFTVGVTPFPSQRYRSPVVFGLISSSIRELPAPWTQVTLW